LCFSHGLQQFSENEIDEKSMHDLPLEVTLIRKESNTYLWESRQI